MSKKSSERSRAERAAAVMAERKRKERMRNLAVVGAVVAVLVVIGAVLYLTSSSKDTSGKATSDVPSGLTGQYAVTVGDASAPKTIAIYEDLQCPICQQFEKATGEQVRQAIADGKVKVEYHMVSFLDRASTNDYSSRALNALMVVFDQDGPDAFEKFHTYLYEHQPEEGSAGPSDEELIDAAVDLGADRSAVTDPINDKVYSQWIVNATDQMSKDGVNGTPTAFIDGKPAGSNPAEALQAVLDAVS